MLVLTLCFLYLTEKTSAAGKKKSLCVPVVTRLTRKREKTKVNNVILTIYKHSCKENWFRTSGKKRAKNTYQKKDKKRIFTISHYVTSYKANLRPVPLGPTPETGRHG